MSDATVAIAKTAHKAPELWRAQLSLALAKVLHLTDGLLHADEHRPRNNAVPNVEFFDFGNLNDRSDVFISQPVTGVHAKA